MKHLVFLTEHLSFGGAERALVEYLVNIDRSKYKVSLILRDDAGPDNYLLASIPKDVEIKILHTHDNRGITAWGHLRRKLMPKWDLTFRIHKALRELKLIAPVDLLLDFTSVLFKQGFMFSGYKKIYWIHGPKSHMGTAELKKFSWRLNSYDLVAVVSDHLKLEIEHLLPKFKSRLVSIYNPFDIDRIINSSFDESELSEKEHELINQRYILAVGRFAVEKDYFTLVEAYKKLKSQNVDYKLYLIGNGPGFADIQAKVKAEGLENDIILLGAKKNPYIWMRKSILFVHSAKAEGFGLVIVEAMALGKAVISTDCPVGPGEILCRGRFGKLVPVANADAMAYMIQEMVDNPVLRAESQSLAAQRAKDYSVDRLLPDFYKIIDI
ncbi:MAG: glycosyltransferase [Bdellovibrio sp.]|nr:glycosyltransferase [Bdellovibrio sp.]